MEFTFLSRKTITDSDFKVNASQGNARLMLNTRPNMALKQLPGFAEVSPEVKTTIVTLAGSLIAKGILVINPQSTRLSLNQAKALFEQAGVKTGDKYDMYACVYDGHLNLKLVKAEAGTAAPPAPSPLPQRKRRAPGAENAPQNTNVAPSSNSAPDFEFAFQDAVAAAPAAAITPVKAVRAKRTVHRPRKVLPNKRISGSATSTEPLVVVAPQAPEIDSDISASASLRGKRKNAGKNRRYSDDDYVVEEVENEATKRQKRRRTSDFSNSSGVEAQVTTWMSIAPEGPVSSHLVEAAVAYKSLNTKEVTAWKALVELEEQSHISNITLGPALALLANVAVAVAENGDLELDAASEMDLD